MSDPNPELEAPGIYVADLDQLKKAIDMYGPFVKRLTAQLDSYKKRAQHVANEFGRLPLDETRHVNDGYAELVKDTVKYMSAYVGRHVEFLMALEFAYAGYMALDGRS